jgi:predicted double-glycine peptidase
LVFSAGGFVAHRKRLRVIEKIRLESGVWRFLSLRRMGDKKAARWVAFLLVLLASIPKVAPADLEWLEVPFVEQVKSGCGSAAIAMVVQYWARQNHALDAAAADAERINQFLPATSAKGIQGQALKNYLEERGFDVFVFSGELRDLEHHFEKGRPVVVCFGLKGPRGPLHYSVVAGIDRDSVRLNDPARGKLIREDLGRFQAAWKVTGNWALLAVPRHVP